MAKFDKDKKANFEAEEKVVHNYHSDFAKKAEAAFQKEVIQTRKYNTIDENRISAVTLSLATSEDVKE